MAGAFFALEELPGTATELEPDELPLELFVLPELFVLLEVFDLVELLVPVELLAFAGLLEDVFCAEELRSNEALFDVSDSFCPETCANTL